MAEQGLNGNSLPGELVVIPKGGCSMGDDMFAREEYPGLPVTLNGVETGRLFAGQDSDEFPEHRVLVDAFAMGKYAVTNGEYGSYLNAAAAQGQITVINGVVYQAGTGTHYPYCDTSASNSASQIAYGGGIFTVQTKSGRDMARDPMICVSWYGAAAYCNWRSRQEGREEGFDLSTWTCDFDRKGYRLPTEAEWEYAARGGLYGKQFPWGDSISQIQANFFSGSEYPYDTSPVKEQHHSLWNDGIPPYTAPAGFFDGGLKCKTDYNWPGSAARYQTIQGSNGYGLYDMAGNTWDWCYDWYGRYSSSAQTNPTGPDSGKFRILRGGGWRVRAVCCRVSRRNWQLPSHMDDVSGCRVVLDIT